MYAKDFGQNVVITQNKSRQTNETNVNTGAKPKKWKNGINFSTNFTKN